jgi:hypothetical protein
MAEILGASLKSANSNEAMLDGHRVVIKCASPATDQVGVVAGMLDRLDFVVGCFEAHDGSFEVWDLPVEHYIRGSFDSKSTGHRPGTVIKQRNRIFRERGSQRAKITADEVTAARQALGFV